MLTGCVEHTELPPGPLRDAASGSEMDPAAQLSVPPWSPGRAGSTARSERFAHTGSEREGGGGGGGGCHEDVLSTNVPPWGEALQAEHLLLQLAEGRSAQRALPALSCPSLPARAARGPRTGSSQ